MIEFNSENIITGYIKQLLHTFNLPTIPIYDEKKKFEGQYLIKDNKVILIRDGKEEEAFNYFWNFRILPNMINHLELKSNIYDTYTHEYLGNYLRFLRDYKHLNLMPLYNCFSNKIVSNFNFDKTTIVTDEAVLTEDGEQVLTENDEAVIAEVTKTEYDVVNSNTDNYKIYAIPVKFGQKYTIAVDSNFPIELLCGFYSEKPYIVDSSIYKKTHTHIANSRFNKPFIFDRLVDYKVTKELLKHEENLKLYIKLPANNKSSIVVLEGDYTSCNKKIIKNRADKDTTLPLSNTQLVINWDNIDVNALNNITLPSNLQLLTLNSNINHPFSDKLISYLLDNVITNTDEIEDNIIRLQKDLVDKKLIKANNLSAGEWTDNIKYMLYDLAYKNNIIANSFDILGYVDKDIEKKLDLDKDIYGESIEKENNSEDKNRWIF